jgi:uncharacterized membrane protein
MNLEPVGGGRMRVADIGPELEMAVGQWLKVVGVGIEAFGALVIVAGLGWSTLIFLQRKMAQQHYEAYKIRIGRSLLLGLEVVVAADIVKTIAVEPTLASLAVLAGLVLIRTFLSWTLVLEIEGRWPWKRVPDRPAEPCDGSAPANSG